MNKYRGLHKKLFGWIMHNAPASRNAVRAAFACDYSGQVIARTIDGLLASRHVVESDGVIDLNREIVK